MNKVLDNSLGNEKTYSPGEVMKILNSDNQEIQRLCKEVSIYPKKDNKTGKIFFFKNDVDVLKKLKDLHNKSQKIAKNNMDNEVVKKSVSKTSARTAKQQEKSDKSRQIVVARNVSNPIAVKKPESTNIADSINNAQQNIVSSLSSYIDEKLDGLDEVIVDLIKSKVENERLKSKIEQLTAENYDLNSKVNSFSPIGFGLFLKKD